MNPPLIEDRPYGLPQHRAQALQQQRDVRREDQFVTDEINLATYLYYRGQEPVHVTPPPPGSKFASFSFVRDDETEKRITEYVASSALSSPLVADIHTYNRSRSELLWRVRQVQKGGR